MQLFPGNDLFELFTTETNRHHIRVSNKYKKYKIAKWTDVTIQEMKQFMGSLILLGQIREGTFNPPITRHFYDAVSLQRGSQNVENFLQRGTPTTQCSRICFN
uniref:PiggyBac transposable element-derived protein domain-containing protein n=1 Tax=Glossina austeni TaxID=7395 RepID=A0A1A9UED0_GLOAU